MVYAWYSYSVIAKSYRFSLFVCTPKEKHGKQGERDETN
jgi:hypothetical protein